MRDVKCFFLSVLNACVAVSDFKAIFDWFFFNLHATLFVELVRQRSSTLTRKTSGSEILYFDVYITFYVFVWFSYSPLNALLKMMFSLLGSRFWESGWHLKEHFQEMSWKYAEIHVWFCCLSFFLAVIYINLECIRRLVGLLLITKHSEIKLYYEASRSYQPSIDRLILLQEIY